jgi:hypothetical protein
MNLIQMRGALVNHLESNWVSGVPIYYENAEEIDAVNLQEFLKCDIHFNAAVQANIDTDPFHRTYGTLVFQVFVRQSKGTVGVLGYLQTLTDMFKHKTLSGVHLQTPSPGKPISKGGWFSMELRTQFHADSNV